MAFSHGTSADIYVNGRDLAAYFRAVEMGGMADVVETTTFGDTAKDYIAGIRDGSVSVEGLFDGATSAVDEVLNTALGSAANSIWVYFPQGETALGDIGYGMTAVATNYSVASPADGVVSVTGEAQAAVGRERGKTLHVLGAETTTGNGTSNDNAAATTAGASAYIHCTAFTGTSITVTIQDSADNSSFATIGTFTAIAAAGSSERIAIAGNVRRYVRHVRAGTFTTATFSVLFCRK